MFGYQVVTNYAPQPTFAVQPTFEQQPTFMPQPTFLIEPTFTFTPSSTPTKTPTNTPTFTPTSSATPTQLVQTGIEFGSSIAVLPDGNNAQTSVAHWDGNTLYIYSSSSEDVEYSYGEEFVTATPVSAHAYCKFMTTYARNVTIQRCKLYIIGDNPSAFRAPGLVNASEFYPSSLPGGPTQYSQFATAVPSAAQTNTPEAPLPVISLTPSATPTVTKP